MARRPPLARARQCRRGRAPPVMSARSCASKGQPRRPLLLILTRLRWHLGAAFTRLEANCVSGRRESADPHLSSPFQGEEARAAFAFLPLKGGGSRRGSRAAIAA